MRWFTPLWGLLLVLIAAPALAQEEAPPEDAPDVDPAVLEQARQRFEEGLAAHEVGRFEEALTAFQEAYELTSNPDLLYNVASTADRLRQDRVALAAYRGYLAARPDSADRVQVEARIRVLSERIAEEDAEAQRAAEEQARREAAEAERQAEAAALRERLQEAEQNPRTVVVREGDVGPAPWIIFGGGVAAAGVGVTLVVLAALDGECVAAPETCTADPAMPQWSEVSERYDRIPTFAAVGATLLGLGGVAMAVGLGWGLATLGDGSSQEPVTLHVGPASLAVSGAFP